MSSSSEEEVTSEAEVASAPEPQPQRAGEASLSRALKILKEHDEETRAKVGAEEVAEKGAGEGMGTGAPPRARGQEQPNQQVVVVPQTAEAQQAAAAARTAREQALMMQQAAAAQQQRHHPAVAQHGGTGRGFPEGHRRHPRQQMEQRMAKAPGSSAFAAQAAREQAMMMQQAASAQQRLHHQDVAPHARTGFGFRDGYVHEHAHWEMIRRMAEAPESSSAAAARAAREQAMMLQQAAAAQQQRHPVAHNGTGLAIPDGRVYGHQQTAQHSAGAQRSVTADQVAREQEMLRQRQLAAYNQTWQQLAQAQQRSAAAEAARQQDMMMRQAAAQKYAPSAELCQHLGLNKQLHDQLMGKAAKRAAAAETATREHDMMMRRAAAAQKYQYSAELYEELGLNQQLHIQLMAEAGKWAAAAEAAAREQDLMRQAAAEEQQYYNPAPAAQHAAVGHDASLGQQQLGLTVMPVAQAQQLAAAVEELARKQDTMIRQAAAAAGLTPDQYSMIMMQQQAVAGGQQHHDQSGQYAAPTGLTRNQNVLALQQAVAGQQHHDQAGQYAAAMGLTMNQNVMTLQQAVAGKQRHDQAEQYYAAAMGLTRDQNVTALQQAVAGQQHHDQVGQYAAAMGHDVTLEQQIAQEMAREQELMMMRQQQATAYARVMPGGGSGATTMPFLPGASANSEAFLVQQLQTTQTTVNAQFHEESSLPPQPSWLINLSDQGGSASGTTTMQFLPGASADSETFLVQQQTQLLPQTGNGSGSQVGSSLPPLPPSLDDLPQQQQNNGDDEDQSVDFLARLWPQ